MKKFILGIFSVIFVIPILESITELICSWIEVLKVGSTKRVIIGNNEIADLQMQLEPIQTQAIGFSVPNNEDYYEDFEENRSKNKIGF